MKCWKELAFGSLANLHCQSINCVNLAELLLPKWPPASVFGTSRGNTYLLKEIPVMTEHADQGRGYISISHTIGSRAFPGISVFVFPSSPAKTNASLST